MHKKKGIKGIILDCTGNEKVDIKRDIDKIKNIAEKRKVPVLVVIQGNRYYTIM